MYVEGETTIDACKRIDFMKWYEETAYSGYSWGVIVGELDIGGKDVVLL